MEKMCKVEISARYVRELENELEAKINEVNVLKVQISELKDNHMFDVMGLKNDVQFQKEIADSYCKDYKIALQKNAKLRKKLAELKHQRKSVLNTLDEMFKIRGE
jgi:hypothetical protein